MNSLSNSRQSSAMSALDLTMLSPLMARTSGQQGIGIGLIDGPIALDHPDFAGAITRDVSNKVSGRCLRADSTACVHGTFVAGVLCGKRGSAAPSICPRCTLLVRPIFAEATTEVSQMPSATPLELATAIIESIHAGACVLNLSVGLANQSAQGERELEQALDYSARRGVIVVAAAGNQATLGSSAITRHPWVIPVAACDLRGRPTNQSNIGSSIGRRGLSAPGDRITSLGSGGQSIIFGGTSAAAPFVTGTIALLWSEHPGATAAQVKLAVTQTTGRRRAAVIPKLLDAWSAYEMMKITHS